MTGRRRSTAQVPGRVDPAAAHTLGTIPNSGGRRHDHDDRNPGQAGPNPRGPFDQPLGYFYGSRIGAPPRIAVQSLNSLIWS